MPTYSRRKIPEPVWRLRPEHPNGFSVWHNASEPCLITGEVCVEVAAFGPFRLGTRGQSTVQWPARRPASRR